jgi:hypothetical protein
MIVSHSGLRYRCWVTGLLLAVYGSAGVLGYGLHAVWECEHHCQEHVQATGTAHSLAHEHGPCCHHKHDTLAADHDNEHATLALTSDDCPICEFLIQAQTPLAIEFTAACIGPAISVLAPFEGTYVAPLSPVSSARGPPTV